MNTTPFWAMVLVVASAVAGGNRDMTDISEVKKQNESSLLAISGVVSVGIGLDDKGQKTIMVGVRSEDAARQARIPNQLEGHPVIVNIVGTIRAD